MMVFSVPISLQIPLKLPDVCLMENSPFSKADFISAGSSSISSIYTGIHGKFRKWGCDASPTFKYWDMFLVAVQIMLSNVRAEREGDWSEV
jgi:hypothetical protein